MDKFVVRKNKKPTNHKIHNKPKRKSQITHIVYTDGACSNNGKPYARAGYGVYFGKDDPRNVSETFNGPQTNNAAELLAIIKALTILSEEIMLGYKIVIYSDSSYAIRCCTTYGAKCFKKNWTNPNNKNKPIPNLEIVKTAYLFCKDYSNIEFIHIAAHTGEQDEHSLGNEMADKLANESIGEEYVPYKKKVKEKKRIYLNVPFGEKDEAKQMGARWESSKKRWYIDGDNKHKVQMMGRWGLD